MSCSNSTLGSTKAYRCPVLCQGISKADVLHATWLLTSLSHCKGCASSLHPYHAGLQMPAYHHARRALHVSRSHPLYLMAELHLRNTRAYPHDVSRGRRISHMLRPVNKTDHMQQGINTHVHSHVSYVGSYVGCLWVDVIRMVGTDQGARTLSYSALQSCYIACTNTSSSNLCSKCDEHHSQPHNLDQDNKAASSL